MGHVCICLFTCDHASDVDLLMYRMNGTRHYGCMGQQYRYHRMENIPGVSLESHLERIETFIHGRLMGILNDYLRIDNN